MFIRDQRCNLPKKGGKVTCVEIQAWWYYERPLGEATNALGHEVFVYRGDLAFDWGVKDVLPSFTADFVMEDVSASNNVASLMVETDLSCKTCPMGFDSFHPSTLGGIMNVAMTKLGYNASIFGGIVIILVDKSPGLTHEDFCYTKSLDNDTSLLLCKRCFYVAGLVMKSLGLIYVDVRCEGYLEDAAEINSMDNAYYTLFASMFKS
ncbi:hypothetical protein Tco_1549272 [Tanacetum coccineum]